MTGQKHTLENSSTLWFLFVGVAGVTLYFDPKVQDPFNSPKMWALLILSAWLMGHLISHKKDLRSNNSIWLFTLVVIIFLVFLIISVLQTDFKYTALFGENLRRNGLLTYLGLGVIAISSALFVRVSNIGRLFYVVGITAISTVVYGFMQYSGNDFVAWNNPYNPVITTLGNPNFSAALMAILATLLFTLFLTAGKRIYVKILSGILISALLIMIVLSNARQGLISLSIGIGFLIGVYIWNKNQKIGVVVAGLMASIGTVAVFGMLQIGPFQEYLYKTSVSIRGYYWRAGVEMFLSNPLWGVGSDRYGSYFKEYREVGYVLNHGFDITSTNAHNVPIQIFATGGIFVGAAYLALIFFIVYRTQKTLRSTSGSNQIIIAGVFAAWLAFQAQSIVSIDNIGLSVWGWLLGGSLIGLSTTMENDNKNDKNQTKSKSNKIKINILQPFASSLFVIFALLLTSTLYKGELIIYQTRATYDPQNLSMKSYTYDYANRTINTRFIDPSYQLMASSYLIGSGFINEGKAELLRLNKLDPRNLDVLNLLSGLNEQMGLIDEAISNRVQIAELDPWNAKNFLALGKLYKLQGNTNQVRNIIQKIDSFASTDPIAIQSKLELLS